MLNKHAQFKQTEIGLIPEDWEVWPLAQVAKFQNGHAFYSDGYSTSGYLAVDLLNISEDGKFKLAARDKFVSTELANKYSKFILDKGDFVMAMTDMTAKLGILGKCAIIPEDNKYILNQRIGRIIPNESVINKNYLYHFINSPYFLQPLHEKALGTVQFYVNTGHITENLIAVPPLPEQQKIAEVLGALDEKIELNRKMNKTLEFIGQAIFKHTFCHSGLDPESRKVGKLGDIADVTSGKRPEIRSNEKMPEFTIPLIGAGSIMGYTNKPLYENKDIIVTGRVGTHGVLQRINYPCWPSDNTLVIISKFPNFTHEVMKDFDFQSLNRGSTQPLITQTDLKNFEIDLPSTDSIEKFELFMSPINQLKIDNMKEIEILSQIRDSLLPRLMSGKLRVK